MVDLHCNSIASQNMLNKSTVIHLQQIKVPRLGFRPQQGPPRGGVRDAALGQLGARLPRGLKNAWRPCISIRM